MLQKFSEERDWNIRELDTLIFLIITVNFPENTVYFCAADFSFAQLAKGKKSRS
jgi:hypothetical protein